MFGQLDLDRQAGKLGPIENITSCRIQIHRGKIRNTIKYFELKAIFSNCRKMKLHYSISPLLHYSISTLLFHTAPGCRLGVQ
jgi:hypothetical protein